MFANMSKKALLFDLSKGRMGSFIAFRSDASEPKLMHPIILPFNRWRSKKNYEIFPETYSQEAITTYKPPQDATSHSIQPEYIFIWETSSGERPFWDAIHAQYNENFGKIKQQLDSAQLDLATQKFISGQSAEESAKKLQRERENKMATPQRPFNSFYPESFDSRLRGSMYPPQRQEPEYMNDF